MKKRSSRRTSKPAPPSPEQRARICERIHYQLALEYLNRSNHRRHVWARLAIGLPPIPRPIMREQSR
jgi:hypothetical protein